MRGHKLDHGNYSQLLELTMTVTINRKVVLDLLGKARTGNDLLSVLDMIATTFTEPSNTVPTMEEIEF